MIDEGRTNEKKQVEAKAKTDIACNISGMKRRTRSLNTSDHMKKRRRTTKDTNTRIVATDGLVSRNKKMSFEGRCNKMLGFKEEFGHCDVLLQMLC